ncbi:MAG: hypothetical protein ABI397_01805 [Candidatus Saccharimonas sp.]
MKKLLYLIPLTLAILSFTPFALYKDGLDHGSSSDPSIHSRWTSVNMGLDDIRRIDTGPVVFGEDGFPKPAPEVDPFIEKTTFRGFPFGAYFNSTDANSEVEFSSKAYSWLWATADLLLIVGSLIVARKVNREKKEIVSVDSRATPQSNPNLRPDATVGIESPTASSTSEVQPTATL